MDKETASVLLIIACIIGGVAVAQPLLPSNGQSFSALGVLGPQKTLSGYPTSIAVNQTFLLYGYIGNYEGSATFYELFVKLGNASTLISNSTSSVAPVITEYSYIVSNEENATFPMNITIGHSGTNLRLLFELWSYDPAISNFKYTGLWNQLWLNVTTI